MAKSECCVPLVISLMFLMMSSSNAFSPTWLNAHATFYGDLAGRETMQGACGYGNLFDQGYGLATTALSTALFNNGLACGACFEIRCVNDPQWCIRGAPSIRVTATNFCPPTAKSNDNWCNPPQRHFDLSQKMFISIAKYRAGIVPVQYRRVPCIKAGGVRFQLAGNPYALTVLVFNVANAGDVQAMSIKGSRTGWIVMTRNWGQNWNGGGNLVGQALSLRVTTSDRKTLEFPFVVPANWRFGQSFQSRYNF